MQKQIFKNNFLKDVVLQINFNNNIPIDTTIIKEFYNSLPYEGKIVKEEELKSLEVKIGKDSEHLNMRRIGKSCTINFQGGYKFILNHEKFLLSSSIYQRFSSFYKVFRTGINKLKDIIKLNEIKRIGNRYINIIKLGSKEVKSLSNWTSYINPRFIPNYSKLIIDETGLSLRRNMNNYVFGDNNYFINLKTGIWNSNYPGLIANDEFIIDIDSYMDNTIIDFRNIIDIPPKLNELAFKCFYSLTTDKLRTVLNSK